jgi:hypothetical protein
LLFHININIRGQMINCLSENSQASGSMTNPAGCKHIYHPASDFFFIIWPCILMYWWILLTWFLSGHCLFVSLVVSFGLQMTRATLGRTSQYTDKNIPHKLQLCWESFPLPVTFSMYPLVMSLGYLYIFSFLTEK